MARWDLVSVVVLVLISSMVIPATYGHTRKTGHGRDFDVRVYCPRPPVPANGRMLYTGQAFNSKAELRCNRGYMPDRYGRLVCDVLGEWFGVIAKCVDIDECYYHMDSCAARNQTCHNYAGSYMCGCGRGFYSHYGRCIDFDECAKDLQKYFACPKNLYCINTPGSYKCGCMRGFQPFLSHNNTYGCYDIDECRAKKSPCYLKHTFCDNTIGSYACYCDYGYQVVEGQCVDIDECSVPDTYSRYCPKQFMCINYQGTYWCGCRYGYHNVSNVCEDVDECASNKTNPCLGQCFNTIGSFQCLCPKGYQGDGIYCHDEDECFFGTDNCSLNATCTNTKGSFTCKCNPGFFDDNGLCIRPESSRCGQTLYFHGFAPVSDFSISYLGLKDLLTEHCNTNGGRILSMVTTHDCNRPFFRELLRLTKLQKAAFIWSQGIVRIELKGSKLDVANIKALYEDTSRWKKLYDYINESIPLLLMCGEKVTLQTTPDTFLVMVNSYGDNWFYSQGSRRLAYNDTAEEEEFLVLHYLLNAPYPRTLIYQDNMRGVQLNKICVCRSCAFTHHHKCHFGRDHYCKNCKTFFHVLLDKDECRFDQPCKNNGTCVNTIGGYQCHCQAGYSGKNCQEDLAVYRTLHCEVNLFLAAYKNRTGAEAYTYREAIDMCRLRQANLPSSWSRRSHCARVFYQDVAYFFNFGRGIIWYEDWGGQTLASSDGAINGSFEAVYAITDRFPIHDQAIVCTGNEKMYSIKELGLYVAEISPRMPILTAADAFTVCKKRKAVVPTEVTDVEMRKFLAAISLRYFHQRTFFWYGKNFQHNADGPAYQYLTSPTGTTRRVSLSYRSANPRQVILCTTKFGFGCSGMQYRTPSHNAWVPVATYSEAVTICGDLPGLKRLPVACAAFAIKKAQGFIHSDWVWLADSYVVARDASTKKVGATFKAGVVCAVNPKTL